MGIAAAALLLACTGPRAVLHSPEATPKGDWRLGGSMDANLPTQTSAALFSGLEDGIGKIYRQARAGDSAVPITADSLNQLTRALIAYSIDPIGVNPSLFLRYGLWDRLDAGYRWAGGAHALDFRWQFLGPRGSGPGWRGSLALQYSRQSFELPSFLADLQEILRFEFERQDFLVPLLFGRRFGADGRYGDFALGAAYDLALIEYGSEATRLVERVDSATVRSFERLGGERAVHAFGGFANVKAGYRHFFVLASAALYRQDYGTFRLFGGKSTRLEGWTLSPAFGFEVRF